jgi:hypothetical protein
MRVGAFMHGAPGHGPGQRPKYYLAFCEFGFGQGLSAPVSSALPLVVERACELVGGP